MAKKLKRAAVVIGVDKVEGFNILESAAQGAIDIAEWLEKEEGFTVKLITDKENKVRVNDIVDAFEELVTIPPRYHQLLVYFSGHGYWINRSDYWLLSEARKHSHEAINLDGAMDSARYSGIPNIIFISDACRSIPDTRKASRIEGISAISDFDEIKDISKIDFFKATSDAQVAYEIDINGKPTSVLTHAFLAAYKEASSDMIKMLEISGKKLEVIPNRNLENYLQKKVTALLEEKSIITQRLDINVPSRDDIYIGKVLGKIKTTIEEEVGVLNVSSDAPNALTKAWEDKNLHLNNLSLEVESPKTEKQIKQRLPNHEVDHFESGCGFTLKGAIVKKVICTKGNGSKHAKVELLSKGNTIDDISVIRVHHAYNEGVSVLILLSDGRGIVIPAIDQYIGHLFVNESGLANVNYVPSSYSWQWHGYSYKKQKIDRYRALVAMAVEQNTFKLRSTQDAHSMADMIRMEKSIDPTLGLYAAHAYYQVGDEKGILSIRHYMEGFMGVFFDIYVMTSRDKEKPNNLLPFCPVLTQTWNLLSSRNISIAPFLEEASLYLCNSLWTTFEKKGANIIYDFIKKDRNIK